MDKDNKDSALEFDQDSEFTERFQKNIEKVINDIDVDVTLEVHEDKPVADESEDQGNANPSGVIEGDDASRVENVDEDNMDEDIDDEINGISSSLAKQISDVIEDSAVTSAEPKRKKMPRWLKIQTGIIITLACLVCVGLFLVYTKPGRSILKGMGGKIGGEIWDTMTNDFDDSEDLPSDLDEPEEVDEPDVVVDDKDDVVVPEPTVEGRHEDYAINVLLLGEEAIESGSARGRTDVMVIATLNTKENSIKLTSIMRDTLVNIPGYKDNRINSVYEKGGIDLLYDVIEQNFDLKLDGSVLVGFEKFEKIINMLDGLEITLTEAEAEYLNTTNYISKKEYRNVKPGKQVMNGNQVLGYARIRKEATITGNHDDFGRTDRHRIILNGIFEKYKTRSKLDLASIMLQILPMLSTDIDKQGFEEMLGIFFETGATKIEQLRLPADDTFKFQTVREMDVIVADMEKNVEILHKHIFGDTEANQEVTTGQQ